MEERQEGGATPSVFQPPPSGAAAPRNSNKDKAETLELGEKMKKIEVKPALGVLAKNAVLLPSGIARVKQLRDAAANQAPPSSSSSSGSATGNPRNKTALAPGHSLMDWIRLGSSGVDLTGVAGRLLSVSPAELAKHSSEDDAWIAIRGVVFNVSRYASFHPGGVSELMRGVGKDATKLFDDVHAWVNYQSILQKCVVGRLERSSVPAILPKTEQTSKKGASPPSTAVKMDWRQTTNSVTMYYATSDDPIGECRIQRLGPSEFSLRVCLDRSGQVVAHNVKLNEEVDWPPNCQTSSEASELEIVFKKKDRGIWKKYGSFSESREKADPTKRTYNEYQVLENTPLCKAVHLLVLRAQNYMQLVPPGRHVEAKMEVLGTEVSRPYTPVPRWFSSEDRAAAASEDCLCLVVKRYEDGAMTPSLTALQPGHQLCLSGALGDFRATDFDAFAQIHLLAAGTGLTVMLPVLKRALSKRNPPSINLINFNRNEGSIFYARQLDRVSEERSLTVTHVLSEPESSWSGRTGNVSEELLKDLMGECSAEACVFTCGPPAFMRLAGESLRKLGWQPSQMHEFDG